MHRILYLVILLLPLNAMAIEESPLASDDQVRQALSRFQEWIRLYQQENYLDQYERVHPRIQRYKNYLVWKKAMNKSRYKNGPLLEYELVALSAITPSDIPCTEMGHCYRKGMQTVIIIVNSRYEKIGVKAKEYVIMANSEDGWMFGGGTILNIPFGETMGILDRADEKKYEYKGISN